MLIHGDIEKIFLLIIQNTECHKKTKNTVNSPLRRKITLSTLRKMQKFCKTLEMEGRREKFENLSFGTILVWILESLSKQAQNFLRKKPQVWKIRAKVFQTSFRTEGSTHFEKKPEPTSRNFSRFSWYIFHFCEEDFWKDGNVFSPKNTASSSFFLFFPTMKIFWLFVEKPHNKSKKDIFKKSNHLIRILHQIRHL